MLKYIHFALPNLYLLNGYEETQIDGQVQRSYVELDRLENSVARLLLRQPKRLRGWDFRFLRNELGLSQRDAGKLVDRDAQTIARWEKTKRKVSAFVDLTIRCRFAAQFEPGLRLQELLAYVDGTAPQLPERIFLQFANGEWSFLLKPTVALAKARSATDSRINWPGLPGPTEAVYQGIAIASATRQAAYGLPVVRGATTRGNLVVVQGGEDVSGYISIGERKSVAGVENDRKH